MFLSPWKIEINIAASFISVANLSKNLMAKFYERLMRCTMESKLHGLKVKAAMREHLRACVWINCCIDALRIYIGNKT